MHEHDVLVIGAGEQGWRRIEASAAGVKVGLLCRSLLGKAHTVMAEGGVAAALANVDDRDSWKVHFADTMRGGQYVNNWRMAALHARKRRIASASSRHGAPSSIARPTAASSSAISAVTSIRDWLTSAIGRASR